MALLALAPSLPHILPPQSFLNPCPDGVLACLLNGFSCNVPHRQRLMKHLVQQANHVLTRLLPVHKSRLRCPYIHVLYGLVNLTSSNGTPAYNIL